MRVLSGSAFAAMSGNTPAEPRTIAQQWLAGPVHGDRLDACLIAMSAGTVTPFHGHHGGRVLLVSAGRGFADDGAVEGLRLAATSTPCEPPEISSGDA